MPATAERIAHLCEQLQAELMHLGLWSDATPHPDALASTQPFAYDTLPFEGWLQWILLPRVRQCLLDEHPLPGRCEAAPMVSVSFAEQPYDVRKLEQLLQALDAALNDWQQANHQIH